MNLRKMARSVAPKRSAKAPQHTMVNSQGNYRISLNFQKKQQNSKSPKATQTTTLK